MIGRIAALSFLVSAGATVCLLWLFPLELSSGGAALSGFSTIYQIILDIVPSDIISPFLNGNTLQIIFLGAAVGIALLILGDRAAAVRTFIEQTNEVVQFLMEAIGDLIPLFVFSVCSLCWAPTSAPSSRASSRPSSSPMHFAR